MTVGKSEPDQDQKDLQPLDADALLITCDDDEDIVVRQSFRVPAPHSKILFTVDNKEFEVLDLSLSGLGICIDDPELFTVGEVMLNAKIIFPDQAFGVDVEVIHISPYESERLICGLEIIKTLDSGYVDWVSRVIVEIKSSVLSVFKETSS